MDALERLGKLPGWRFGELVQGGCGHMGMRLQEFSKEGGRQSGKPSSLFEGMLRGGDHQKEQLAGANPLKPPTDGDLTCDPSLQGAREHRASPRGESS